MKNVVTLKGINGEVLLMIDPVAPFEEVFNSIRELVQKGSNFFRGGFLTIDTQGRSLSEEELKSIEEIFKGIGVSFRLNRGGELLGGAPIGEKVLTVERTVRSGQLIRFDGNVVILGNVNPDGVVEATNDVFVFGVIKGKVKAGRRIVALGFQSQGIIIGTLEANISTSEKSRKPHICELGKDGVIIFSPLEGKELKPARRGKNG